MNRWALFAATAAASTLAVSAHAQDAASLVDRYVAWRGGAAFAKATGLHAVGSATNGRFGGVAERWIAPGRSREAVVLGALTSNQAVTPDGGWTVTLSGQVEQPSPDEAASARRRAALTFDDALRGANGAEVARASDETFDGAKTAVLRVRFGGPDTYDLLIDEATGALKAERMVEDGRTTVVRYEDWRMVQGVRVPFREVQQVDDDPLKVTLAFRSVAVNPPIAPAVWRAPPPERKFVFASQVRETRPLPFEFYLGSRIYIPAKVQGIDTPVLLDSGAEVTVLDKAWAEKAGIKAAGLVTAMGTGGRQEAELASGVDVVVGDLTLRNLTVALVDLSAIARMVGRPIPIVLGKEVFNELAVDLDFDARTIAFHEPAGLVPPAGAVAVPVTVANGLRAIPVSVEGKAPVLMDFDIGNGSPLVIFPAYAAREKLLADGRPVSKTLSGAIGGVKPRDVAVVRDVTLAGVTFKDLPTTFPAADGSAFDSQRTLGNVGLPLLSRFRLVTDYANNRLWLRPGADATRPFPKDRSGLMARMDGDAAQVLFVAPGSPAEAAGFKVGDRLVSLEGKPLAQGGATALQVLRTEPAGKAIALGMQGGETRTLILKDYF